MLNLETNLALRLPVIDFTSQDLKPGTAHWDLVKVDVRRALEEYGCFEALFEVPVELRKAVLDSSEEFFRLPLATKQSIISDVVYKGYVANVGHNPTNPLHEGVGIEFSDNAEKVNDFTQKLWSKGNISFSETVLSFTEKVSKLDSMTRRMIMESFGLGDEYIEEHLNSTKCIFRMNKYKGVVEEEETEEQDKSGMEAHTDRNMLTILVQNNVEDGIEVKTKDDKHWIKANASQDSSFIVVGGSMLHVLLNGRVEPAVHRVVRMGKDIRYSVGLFSVPKSGDSIYAPEEMVGADHPRLYKPFDFEGYFKFTIQGSQRRNLAALKSYCGI